MKVHQGMDLLGDLEDNIATVAAIAAIWAAQGLKLLAVDRHTAVSTVACLQVQDNAVNKTCHGQTLRKLNLCPRQCNACLGLDSNRNRIESAYLVGHPIGCVR